MESADHFARAEGRGTARRRRSAMFAGGIDGNERLTTSTGVLLIVLLAALGVTIVFIGPLLWEHLFIGLLLIGPVCLKLASTGYRFSRYYGGDPVYVRRGPPFGPLRLIAPFVVLTTIAVFATGIVLMYVGPYHRDPWLLLHKAGFIVWIGFTALHVLGHMPETSRLLGLRAEILQLPGLRTDLARDEHPARDRGQPLNVHRRRLAPVRGGLGRATGVGVAVVAGLALAVALVPQYGTWTSHQAVFHRKHEDH